MEIKEKKILKAVVLELRHLLEGRYDNDGRWHPGDLEQRLAAIGIRRKHNPVPIDELPHLSNEDKQAREVVDAYLTLRQEAEIQTDEAIREFVRETAYTWANRLLALRCMEARELIDEVILQKEVYGGRSLEHHRLAQRQPELCAGEDDGLFAVFDKVFVEQANRLPILFDPKAPGVALRPSPAALKDCIGLLSLNPDILSRYRIKIADNQSSNSTPYALSPNPYIAPDALGWAYQYWNTEEKDRVFEKVRTQKGAKIEGADIIPATQLYTEPYMVKFLVQNSLGALWMEMHPDSKLYEQWKYYVKDADRAPVEKKPVREITFLDPACGSGHFLLEAFDLFYEMYEEEAERGWGDDQSSLSPIQICKSILSNNLYGIDIDERAVQIAEAALWMKAAEKAFDFKGVETNLVASNICLPKNKDHLQIFLENHPEDKPLMPAVEAIFEGLVHVDELGSLLKIKELVEEQLHYLRETFRKGLSSVGERKGFQKNMWVPTVIQGQLPRGIESYEQWKEKSLKALKEHFAIETKSANLAQAFFSRFVHKGIELFEILSQHYDTVAANPPYMGSKNMNDMLKKYVQSYYTLGKRDLYAAFILRCLELAGEGGRVAMVTQQSWMFLRSFANLRAVDKKELDTIGQNAFKGILRDTTVETLVHLGPGAFGEISGEVVNIVLFTLAKVVPASNVRLSALRLIGPKGPEEKEALMRNTISILSSSESTVKSICEQLRFLSIPQAPLCYWLKEKFLDLLAGRILAEQVTVRQGIVTGDDNRTIRFFWEVPVTLDWVCHTKGGGYARWEGNNRYVIDWRDKGKRIKLGRNPRYQNVSWYFKEGLWYSRVARNSIGVRTLDKDAIIGVNGPGIFLNHDWKKICLNPLAAFLNSRFATFITRATSQSIVFQVEQLSRVPIPSAFPLDINVLTTFCINLKRWIIARDPTESNFVNYTTGNDNDFKAVQQIIQQENSVAAILNTLEGINEKLVFDSYKLDAGDISTVLQETGTPVGWFPLIHGYDTVPILLNDFLTLPHQALKYLDQHERRILPHTKLTELICQLHALYEAQQFHIKDDSDEMTVAAASDTENGNVGGCIPIPPETFLEELSQKLQIHPISIFWLLEEGIEKEGWRCIPEEQRITADRFTVIILRLLGHKWPKQVKSGETSPDWAIRDGIIPFTEGTNEPTLLDRVRERIAAEFEDEDVSSMEREFAEIMGKPLDQWLETEFFKHHTKQFKKRPIAWQIQSSSYTKRRKPAFACLLYCHKIDGDILPKIRNQYIGPLRQRFETELRGIEAIPLDARSDRQEKRRLELQDLILELKDFDLKLQKTSAEGFACKKLIEIIKKEPLDKWGSIDGIKNPPANQDDLFRQEQSYIPDINDGVRVNIAPLQKAGLLASDVLAKKDIDKAIEDRAEWRTNERRWCREGKLPQPGWWMKDRG